MILATMKNHELFETPAESASKIPEPGESNPWDAKTLLVPGVGFKNF